MTREPKAKRKRLIHFGSTVDQWLEDTAKRENTTLTQILTEALQFRIAHKQWPPKTINVKL